MWRRRGLRRDLFTRQSRLLPDDERRQKYEERDTDTEADHEAAALALARNGRLAVWRRALHDRTAAERAHGLTKIRSLLESMSRMLLEAFLEQRVEPGWHGGVERGCSRRLPGHDARDNGGLAAAVESTSAGRHLVEHGAEREDV